LRIGRETTHASISGVSVVSRANIAFDVAL